MLAENIKHLPDNTKNFNIKMNAKVFSILSSNIYSNKMLAPIRELICNARDIHAEVGKLDVAIDITLPSIFSHDFAVRDYGTGMDEATVLELYTSYGESTKAQKSDDTIGYFGIGSKSPLAYVDSYFISNFTGSRKQMYIISTEDGIPTINLVSDTECDEPQGFEVRFAVQAGDANLFKEELLWFLEFMTGVYNLNGERFVPTIKQENCLHFHNVFTTISDIVGRKGTYALCGGVLYKLENSEIWPHTGVREETIQKSYNGLTIFEFPPKALDISASRESIEYTKKTKAALQKYGETFLADTLATLTEKIVTSYESNDLKLTSFLKLFVRVFNMQVGTYLQLSSFDVISYLNKEESERERTNANLYKLEKNHNEVFEILRKLSTEVTINATNNFTYKLKYKSRFSDQLILKKETNDFANSRSLLEILPNLDTLARKSEKNCKQIFNFSYNPEQFTKRFVEQTFKSYINSLSGRSGEKYNLFTTETFKSVKEWVKPIHFEDFTPILEQAKEEQKKKQKSKTSKDGKYSIYKFEEGAIKSYTSKKTIVGYCNETYDNLVTDNKTYIHTKNGKTSVNVNGAKVEVPTHVVLEVLSETLVCDFLITNNPNSAGIDGADLFREIMQSHHFLTTFKNMYKHIVEVLDYCDIALVRKLLPNDSRIDIELDKVKSFLLQKVKTHNLTTKILPKILKLRLPDSQINEDFDRLWCKLSDDAVSVLDNFSVDFDVDLRMYIKAGVFSKEEKLAYKTIHKYKKYPKKLRKFEVLTQNLQNKVRSFLYSLGRTECELKIYRALL